MYLRTQQLINDIAIDEPDPAAANALQEGLGGQFGEMCDHMRKTDTDALSDDVKPDTDQHDIRDLDPRDTDHPAGAEQAVENTANDSPS